MTVKQTNEQDGVAALTIYFLERLGDPAAKMASSAGQISDKYAPAPSPSEKTLVVDAKGVDYVGLWNRVKSVTGAQEIAASPEEEEEIKKLAATRERSSIDRTRVAGIRQAKKDQERMLQEARGEVAKLKQL
jgi:large subunit ribosomal protein MRP49